MGPPSKITTIGTVSGFCRHTQTTAPLTNCVKFVAMRPAVESVAMHPGITYVAKTLAATREWPFVHISRVGQSRCSD